jgi:hypothetical protein
LVVEGLACTMTSRALRRVKDRLHLKWAIRWRGRGKRFGVEADRALQTPRFELFTNAIGGERCDFTR